MKEGEKRAASASTICCIPLLSDVNSGREELFATVFLRAATIARPKLP